MATSQRAKILLLIPHLGGGGAERIAATLARYLSPLRYELHLGLVTQSSHEARAIPTGGTVHTLGATRVRYGAWRLLWLVWRVRPAVILSGMAHLNLLVLLLRPFFPTGTRVFVRQNGPLAATLAIGGKPRLSRQLYGAGYRRADRVICQTQLMADELQTELGINSAKLAVLSNPVNVQAIRAIAAVTNYIPPSPGPRLTAIARLAPEKGIDLLLGAFAGVLRTFPHAELEIAGSGQCESALKAQCRMLGIESRVNFLGNVAEPASLFPRSSLFVLSSRHEGMPNALLEAAAAGLPIVALPASPGLVERVRGRSGIWIASDISAYALENTLCDALSSIHSGQRFEHAWIGPFDLTNAIPAYERVIDEALRECRT